VDDKPGKFEERVKEVLAEVKSEQNSSMRKEKKKELHVDREKEHKGSDF